MPPRIRIRPAALRSSTLPRIRGPLQILRTTAFLADHLVPLFDADAKSALQDAAALRREAALCRPDSAVRQKLLEDARVLEGRAAACLEYAERVKQLLDLEARGLLDTLEAGRERGPPDEPASSP